MLPADHRGRKDGNTTSNVSSFPSGQRYGDFEVSACHCPSIFLMSSGHNPQKTRRLVVIVSSKIKRDILLNSNEEGQLDWDVLCFTTPFKFSEELLTNPGFFRVIRMATLFLIAQDFGCFRLCNEFWSLLVSRKLKNRLQLASNFWSLLSTCKLTTFSVSCSLFCLQ